MAKATQSSKEDHNEAVEERQQPELDSKYRMIIVAAQRSKQLQRGARPRIEMDAQQHKHTRVALMEVEQGKIDFTIKEDDIEA
ncbi:MAG TPA: DNA-directed RNA polymerase subunit omega [Pyrinomonadaceae bacterium]|nr:DNA-directed RNA polymerase subunit omega [Pyrinomonadaceae bacterium]